MLVEPWFPYQGTEISRLPDASAYSYQTDNIALDADGAPNAYHAGDTGLDALANAGFPDQGWRDVLVVDPLDHGQPFKQTTGVFAGYYVSMTTLRDAIKEAADPTDASCYVDATAIPYIVFPGAFYAIKGTGKWGSIGIARNLSNNLISGFVVADAGPTDAALGEISLRLATCLGGNNPNPRTGAGSPRGPFQYVVFPGRIASPPWPLSETQINALARDALAAAGGWSSFFAS